MRGEGPGWIFEAEGGRINVKCKKRGDYGGDKYVVLKRIHKKRTIVILCRLVSMCRSYRLGIQISRN